MKAQPPQSWPMSLKDFLRVVVGKGIPSARTVKERMRHFRNFLAWWNETAKKAAMQGHMMATEKPELTIKRCKAVGFTEAKFRMFSEYFDMWNAGRKKVKQNRRKPPQSWPMTFKDFLREVVGRNMASARTETDRMRYLKQFLIWWRECLQKGGYYTLEAVTDTAMLYEDWTPEQIIEKRRKDGFSENDIGRWTNAFRQWKEGIFKRRAQVAAKARWGVCD